MSIAALDWAWNQDCPNATSKLILIALADKANDDGECWPGMEHVARMVGISTRQVSSHLQRLESEGILTRKRRRSGIGRLGSYVFHLNVHRKSTSGSTPPVEDGRQWKDTSGSGPPVEADDQWRQTSESTGSPASYPPEAGFRTEPTVNPQGTQREGRASKNKRKPETPLPDHWQPTDAHHRLAAELGVDCDHEAAKFSDHAAANDRRQRDWDASFRTWLRRSRDYGASTGAGNGREPPAAPVREYDPDDAEARFRALTGGQT